MSAIKDVCGGHLQNVASVMALNQTNQHIRDTSKFVSIYSTTEELASVKFLYDMRTSYGKVLQELNMTQVNVVLVDPPDCWTK